MEANVLRGIRSGASSILIYNKLQVFDHEDFFWPVWKFVSYLFLATKDRQDTI